MPSRKLNESIAEISKIIETDGHNWPKLKLELAKLVVEGKADEIQNKFRKYGVFRNISRVADWLMGKYDGNLLETFERAIELAEIYENGPNYLVELSLEILQKLIIDGIPTSQVAEEYKIKESYITFMIRHAADLVNLKNIKANKDQIFKDYVDKINKLDESGEIFFPIEKEFLRLRVEENLSQKDAAIKMGYLESNMSIMELILLKKAIGSSKRTVEGMYREMIELYAIYSDALKKGIVKEVINGNEKFLFEQVMSGNIFPEIRKMRVPGVMHPSSCKNSGIGKIKIALKEAGIWEPGKQTDLSQIDWKFGDFDEILKKLAEKEISARCNNGHSKDITPDDLYKFIKYQCENAPKDKLPVWKRWHNHLSEAFKIIS